MKKLELNQMEKISAGTKCGGWAWFAIGCAVVGGALAGGPLGAIAVMGGAAQALDCD
jgi:hypothetical protein